MSNHSQLVPTAYVIPVQSRYGRSRIKTNAIIGIGSSEYQNDHTQMSHFPAKLKDFCFKCLYFSAKLNDFCSKVDQPRKPSSKIMITLPEPSLRGKGL